MPAAVAVTEDVPGSTSAAAKAARRKRQAEMLKMARDIRKNGPGSVEGSAHKARFWKDVTVQEVDGMSVYLPSHHPQTTIMINN